MHKADGVASALPILPTYVRVSGIMVRLVTSEMHLSDMYRVRGSIDAVF